MEVQPTKSSARGPATWFTGDVYIDAPFEPQPHSRVAVSLVHFAPGARTAWHTHSNGQTLYVTQGEGRVQARGGSILPIHAGNVVHAHVNEWHWHGATPEHTMTHVSITNGDASFGDHVTDAEYAADGRPEGTADHRDASVG